MVWNEMESHSESVPTNRTLEQSQTPNNFAFSFVAADGRRTESHTTQLLPRQAFQPSAALPGAATQNFRLCLNANVVMNPGDRRVAPPHIQGMVPTHSTGAQRSALRVSSQFATLRDRTLTYRFLARKGLDRGLRSGRYWICVFAALSLRILSQSGVV